MHSDSEKRLAETLFTQREAQFERAPFDREIAFYESIGAGDLEMMRFFCAPLFCEGCGILSKDPLQNLKYHMVVTAALVARFCIKYGMTPETAYQISDLYIMQADECRTEEAVRAVHSEMLEHYTKRMQSVRCNKIYSKQIVKAIEYINEHLHSRILLSDAAEALHLSEAYLSRLFKAETGSTFSEFVSRRKIENAAKLVLYSEYTDAEISSLLSFSSQSYFIKLFRKYMGMTPKEYRKNYRVPEIYKDMAASKIP